MRRYRVHSSVGSKYLGTGQAFCSLQLGVDNYRGFHTKYHFDSVPCCRVYDVYSRLTTYCTYGGCRFSKFIRLCICSLGPRNASSCCRTLPTYLIAPMSLYGRHEVQSTTYAVHRTNVHTLRIAPAQWRSVASLVWSTTRPLIGVRF